MRTAQEFRERQIDILRRAFQRPIFFCGRQEAADVYFGTILSELCWLDEMTDEETQSASSLQFSSMRVYGQFYFQHCKIRCYINEIASTYCQACYRTGHFQPERLLSVAEFDQLSASLDEKFFAVDHRKSELVDRFGQPCQETVGGETTVHSYACIDRKHDWIYFDYSRRHPLQDPRELEGWFDDPILRDVRRHRNQFEFLPFGTPCRPSTPPDQVVAMQLDAIVFDDENERD